MLSQLTLVVAGLLWLGLLFGVALYGERHPALLARRWGVIYALSLAVYCTSWTFYGTVTQAARSGWPLPPTFIGTILLYVFGIGLIIRLVRLSREHNASSLADLIATRLGKSTGMAAAVTLIAVLGILPYIALQLKAVAMSFSLLTRASDLDPPPWQDSALYVALAMAVFAMLFGTRSATAAEHNRGLVLAMAMESLLKLGAMLVLGIYVVGRFGWAGPAPTLPDGAAGFPALIALGVIAMFTLPHQFHVGVVECRDEAHLRTARWLFPLYMLLIALPILPLARIGDVVLGPLDVPSDLYVLALPLAGGNEGLAVLAYLGGLSAATGMVILATLSLSLMIGNHWLTPLLLRGRWAQRVGHDLRGSVLLQRRLVIVAVVLLAWVYSRAIAGSEALADIGALSFSALATLAPALALAVFRPATPPRAVLLGLLAGFGAWCWALLLPGLAEGFGWAPAWLTNGPFAVAWLAPDHLLHLDGWSRVSRALWFSIAAGIAVPLLAERWMRVSERPPESRLDHATLGDIARRFLPHARVGALLAGAVPETLADAAAEARVERELASVLGAASARLLLDAARRAHGRDLETVATIVGEASQALRFNQRVLEAALENMGQGISVVDRELRLVAWNRRYARLFGYPSNLLRIGTPVADLVRHNLQRGLLGHADVDAALDRRLAHMRAGTPYVAERHFPGEAVVEIRGNPMPGGGFVATFTDVTAFRRAEAELKQINETLELRVTERTGEYREARAEAERANQAKTRFLAAVSHDLAQPLNAAHLFLHALMQRLQHPQYSESLRNIDGALGSAENLLSGLLDISRLDAGGLQPEVQPFALEPLLQGLAAEFGVLAAERGLQLRHVQTRLWIRSDPQLLRRVLQNFLSNAVRYTPSGRVLLGCRRLPQAVRIEVWDTGVGIGETDQAAIFEEFRRLDRGGQGLGLGLAIADRVARLLDHPIHLRSLPGRGTCFAVELPLAPIQVPKPALAVPAADLPTARTVLVVDNDAAVLRAMEDLLQGWGFSVLAAHGAAEAALLFEQGVAPDALIVDHHLDDGDTGLQLYRRLASRLADAPCVVITADHSEQVRQAVQQSSAWLLHKPLKPLALRTLLARLLG